MKNHPLEEIAYFAPGSQHFNAKLSSIYLRFASLVHQMIHRSMCMVTFFLGTKITLISLQNQMQE